MSMLWSELIRVVWTLMLQVDDKDAWQQPCFIYLFNLPAPRVCVCLSVHMLIWFDLIVTVSDKGANLI
jgi:hypothetical protein